MNPEKTVNSRSDPSIAIALIVGTLLVAPAAAHSQTPTTPVPPTPQTQPPQTPTAPQAAAATKTPALAFASETGVVFTQVMPSKIAAYEEVIGKVRELLRQSANPIRKQQAAGWKLFKASEPYNDRVLYVSVMEPAVPGASYNVFDLLQEGLGELPARELFEKFRAAHSGPQFVLNLDPYDKPAATEPVKK